MRVVHGGDIYRNRVKLDFSVNVNPFGMPEAVKSSLHAAVESSGSYPDITAENLRKTISDMLHIPQENLLFGNGASELFMAIMHGIRPNKTVIPIPSFYGYEYAAEAIEGEVIYYETKQDDNFAIREDIVELLKEDVDLLFLANPNNPTGTLMDMEVLKTLLCQCRDMGILVVLDECFIEFCGEEFSMLWETALFENLILIRAFTKIFAIPGVRLGYLVCNNNELVNRIKRQLPEWNLSSFAQAAGVACVAQTDYIRETAIRIKEERIFLETGLRALGFCVFPTEANFILLFSEKSLYEGLLRQGILIRNCENFKGLTKGFYRIAVKSREENEVLLKALGEINWNIGTR